MRSTSWVTPGGAERCLAQLSIPQACPEPCHEQLTALHAESSEKDRLLFIFYFLDTKPLWPRRRFHHIPGPRFCPCWHFTGHRSCTPFRIPALATCRYLASVWVCQVHRGLTNRQNQNHNLTFDSLLTSHGQRQGMCRVDDMCSQRLA